VIQGVALVNVVPGGCVEIDCEDLGLLCSA
jgi:hypothetical protein